MRAVIASTLVLCLGVLTTSSVNSQEPKAQLQKTPAAVCGDQRAGLPDFYYDGVLSLIKPPQWRRGLIQIMVGGQIKLGLWTDGQEFQSWTNTLDISQKNIGQFLLDLAQTCRLPPDPADAAPLIKINWESKDLSATHFAQLHRDFTRALSRYVANIQGRYAGMIATGTYIVSLDADAYRIDYDNSYEHVQIDATNRNSDLDPMVDWARELQKLGEESFHKPIWQRAIE